MPLFIVAIFVSAFLLFQVQPVIARFILPWYGGSPAVWTTCLLFFQTGLLLGYAYAHSLVTVFRRKRRVQVGIHLGLLLVALILLPITPEAPAVDLEKSGSPVWEILILLAGSVGVPYLLLSASGPLFQHWFAECHPGKSPYRLYAISNVGSLLGLLSYPFLIEPTLGVTKQALFWSFGFVVFAVVTLLVGWRLVKKGKDDALPGFLSDQGGSRLTIRSVALWVALAATGTMLLLSLTNQVCQDVAVIPFFWVVPLSLYLLTFVISFDHPRWYKRFVWIPLAAISVGGVVYLLLQQFSDEEMHFAGQLAIYLAAIFCGCLVAHGEMVRKKPPARQLTAFYLAIAFGGALGGLFVSVIAPLIFDGYWELHISFLVLTLLAAVLILSDLRTSRWAVRLGAVLSSLAIWAVLSIALERHKSIAEDEVIDSRRSFYGVLRVYEEGYETVDQYRSIYHGRISHGMQYTDPSFEDLPTTYYTENSGVGLAFRFHPARLENSEAPLHVGAIGLGSGTVMTYSKEKDRFRFYEINPQVEELARKHFTFLENGEGEETVVLGDARITLQEELRTQGSQEFDLLIVDAFSGDAIPLHLLTDESMELYWKHLKPGGVLAVHISNLHLDLSPPVRTLAEKHSLDAIPIEHDPTDNEVTAYYSDWVLLTRNPKLREQIEAEGYNTFWYEEEYDPVLWTDDYSNLLHVIRWD